MMVCRFTKTKLLLFLTVCITYDYGFAQTDYGNRLGGQVQDRQVYSAAGTSVKIWTSSFEELTCISRG